jgi:RloB-like protein
MRDNQPKARQMRKEQRKLARAKATRAGLPAILIVCEGRETEPNYIEGLCEHLNVNRAAVRIVRGSEVTDSVGLVRRAQRLFKSDGIYDLVYVVCDGDANELAAATAVATATLRNAEGRRTTVQVIASCPSIEYWLLLHFEYSARPFRNAAEVTDELRRHITDYGKNDRDIFTKVGAGLDLACARAEQVLLDVARARSHRPGSAMHLLVHQLAKMKGAL